MHRHSRFVSAFSDELSEISCGFSSHLSPRLPKAFVRVLTFFIRTFSSFHTTLMNADAYRAWRGTVNSWPKSNGNGHSCPRTFGMNWTFYPLWQNGVPTLSSGSSSLYILAKKLTENGSRFSLILVVIKYFTSTLTLCQIIWQFPLSSAFQSGSLVIELWGEQRRRCWCCLFPAHDIFFNLNYSSWSGVFFFF